MKSFKVTVTKTDIEKGFAGHCEKCPIARAVLRDCRAATKVNVAGFIDVYKGNNIVARMKMPKKCELFICRFDDGRKVKPFTFVFRNNAPIAEFENVGG